MRRIFAVALFAACAVSLIAAHQAALRQRVAINDVVISGELKQWHKVTLTLAGPQADETSSSPNPFMDYRMTVTFTHESGSPSYTVPGYFAADGDAANTSATAGNKWRAHLSPDKAGRWNFRIAFVTGKGVAIADPSAGQPVAPFNGAAGGFQIAATDKRAPDFRALGRLTYTGEHYLQFAASGTYFLKLGADAPETLLAYADFDGTVARKSQVPLHTFAPHIQDWKPGDPTWKGDKGKGLIGVVNYLASKGANSISFLPYNAGGDGDNVWPFAGRDDKYHYDVSKLDQWQIVFDYAQRKGLYLHFKLQENEIDDNVRGNPGQPARNGQPPAQGPVVESLDGGDLGPERKLYIRELIARFGYELALNWNLGEENTQSSEQQLAMAMNLRDVDPYGGHHIVVHTFPNAQESVYPALLGTRSPFTGASLQMMWNAVHERTLRWVLASDEAKKPWVVANDEQGPASLGVPPDPGYSGFAGKDAQGRDVGYTLHDIRKQVLWGNLMAGGAGAEYYFGYALPDNDLVAENFRSRDKSWDYGRIAIDFFHSQNIPFWEMKNADELVGNVQHDNSKYCFAKTDEIYLVYLPGGGTTSLDLSKASGQFTVSWFDPRNGGPLKRGSVTSISGGASASLGAPPDNPAEDWLIVVRRETNVAQGGGGTESYPPAFPRQNATKLLETDRIVVWDIVWPKGQPSPLHRHLFDQVGTYYQPGGRVITQLNGTKSENTTPLGNISTTRKGTTHIEEGTTDPPLRAVFIELKSDTASSRNLERLEAPPWPDARQVHAEDRVTVWDATRSAKQRAFIRYDVDTAVVWLTPGTFRITKDKQSAEVVSVKAGTFWYKPGGTVESEELTAGTPRAIMFRFR